MMTVAAHQDVITNPAKNFRTNLPSNVCCRTGRQRQGLTEGGAEHGPMTTDNRPATLLSLRGTRSYQIRTTAPWFYDESRARRQKRINEQGHGNHGTASRGRIDHRSSDGEYSRWGPAARQRLQRGSLIFYPTSYDQRQNAPQTQRALPATPDLAWGRGHELTNEPLPWTKIGHEGQVVETPPVSLI
ncbi:hypothetical protein CMUS01_04150 [Colletotrichum musicola]|uniref:Uncharacterized protein n=1 Tax=Colletotrichum musicola TaxID=2175873 RepID=A0A8H6NNV2_9PEZI|nr:hypothetical protein CMUS01_04150 [Colletotrichum musicola]